MIHIFLKKPSGCGRTSWSSSLSVILNGAMEDGGNGIAADCDYIYVGSATTSAEYRIYKISIENHTIQSAVVPGHIFSCIIVGDYIWTVGSNNYVQKINKHTLIVEDFDAGTVINGRPITFDGEYIWTAFRWTGDVYRIHKDTLAITTYPGILGLGSRHMVFVDGFIWVTNDEANTVTKLNPADQSTIDVSLPGTSPWALTYDGTSIIVAGRWGYIVKIDPHTAMVTADTTIGSATWLCQAVFDGRNVWICDNNNDNIRVIDPLTLSEVRTETTSTMPFYMVSDGKYIWVTHENNTTVLKFEF